jgi:hypothetical protein
MIERLPLSRPFLPSMLHWRLADARVDGPASFGLPPDGVTTDGGGYWIAEFGEMRAATSAEHRAVRALASRMRGGARIDVPFIEQSPTGGLVEVPFSDDSEYSDGTGEIVGLITAELEEAVLLRADTALIRVTGGTLQGADVFSLVRSATLGEEMHLCETMTEIEPGLWSVSIAPQFRQAYAAGTAVNFNNPHCAMRVNDPEGGLWPKMSRSWIARPSVRFVEAVR